MSLRIHALPASPRGFKVISFANHVGIPYEFVLCDFTKGTQKTPEFTRLNPNQRMPVLEEDGWPLWESNAILQYLATKKPEMNLLLQRDERGRADVSRWMFWESAHWDPACVILVFERVVKPLFGRGAPDPAEIEKGLERFHRVAEVLDGHLKGRRFICGDTITTADFSVGAAFLMADAASFPLESYGEIRRLKDTLAALPAWQKALELVEMPKAA
ncbi:MAG TPA: glutathione S-transferase family protein [Rhizomicrobium sp.]|nr:glutathione S-transferase family protein [Rhizomicrobium sp.]